MDSLGIPKLNVNVTGDFKEFLVGNNILTVMAAVTCAFSTGIAIRSLVGNIVLPAIFGLFIKTSSPYFESFTPITSKGISEFLKDFISWIFVIILTFLLIEYVIRRWLLKLPSKKPEEKTKPVVASVAPVTPETPGPEKGDKDNSSTVGGDDGGGDQEMFYGNPFPESYYMSF